MSFSIPSLQALAERTWGAFRLNLKGSDAVLWPNNVAVSAKVIAGAVWEAFSFLDFISRQMFVATAALPWLTRHGAEYGMTRLPATFSEGSARLFGDAGTVVPAGIVLQRADGIRYTVTFGGNIGGLGYADVAVRAQSAGKAGNAPPGARLSLISALARVNTDGEVSPAGIGLGADEEGTESYRARILFRKRMPPHGGAAHDYVAWAREINGVTRVFVDPVTATNGRNSVGVWFLMDSLYDDGLPQAADVAAVAAYIETVRPAGAIVNVAAPVPQSVTISIAGLSPDTSAVRDAIAAELADLFRVEVMVSTLTDPFTLYRSQIVEAISRATGEHHHTLVLPATDTAFATGVIPVLGPVSYA